MSNPDPNTDEYKIAVMQAHLRGEKIEWRCLDENEGWMAVAAPAWDWHRSTYRVAPAPREVWVNEYDGKFSEINHPTKLDAIESAKGSLARQVRQVRFIEAPAE